jgi:acyl-CoA hydrolase
VVHDDSVRHGHEVHIDEWVAPDACDDNGYLRAGKILEWMDVVGALAASRHGRLPGVTVSVDGAELIEPVVLGDRVSMRARVSFTSGRSLGIAVAMAATSRGQTTARPVLTGYMTFVVVDAEGRPVAVPPFTPQTPEEMALHREGAMRRQFRTELAEGRVAQRAQGVAHEQSANAARRQPQLVSLVRELTGLLSARRQRMAPARSAHASYIHKIEPVRAGKLNFHGTLYGGTLMRWIETSATMSASAFVDAPMRLVGVHGLTFVKPVQANVFVHLHAVTVHSDERGVTVQVRAASENPLTSATCACLQGFLSYAPVDQGVAIPAVILEGDDEAATFHEVGLSKALHERVAALQQRGS